MPNLPYQEPEPPERSGGMAWVLVVLGAIAFFGVFIFFAIRW